MTNQIISHLSEKYDVLSPLGSGANATVYRIRHKSLDRELAAKIIPKRNASHLSVLSEARLLRSLHHPGIPMIYDIEEDDMFFYLMEEFIEGPSLDQYLLHHSSISKSFYLKCMKDLCEIYLYLHSLPDPILYQDLKPEHIIVGPEQMKLIDFGGLCSLRLTEIEFPLYGNADFSAPEVLSGSRPTLKSDVYTLGKMMAYLADYLEDPLSDRLQHTIQKALSEADRYETVAEMLRAIEQEQSSGAHLVESIAVIGAYPGSGATHQAICLTSSLNRLGIPCFYLEENDHKALTKLLRYAKSVKEVNGAVEYRWFTGYPKYGPGLSVLLPKNALCLLDCGTQATEEILAKAGHILLVTSNSPWHMEELDDQVKKLSSYLGKLTILCVGGDAYLCRYLKEAYGCPVYSMEFSNDPFSVTRKTRQITAKIMGIKEKFTFVSGLKNRQSVFQKP